MTNKKLKEKEMRKVIKRGHGEGDRVKGIREYENKTIINKRLLGEVERRDWGGFRIVVILREEDKGKG